MKCPSTLSVLKIDLSVQKIDVNALAHYLLLHGVMRLIPRVVVREGGRAIGLDSDVGLRSG